MTVARKIADSKLTLGSTVASLGNTTTTIAGLTLTTPNLGTPSTLTLTNATGLPVSGITSSTTTALGVGSLELGHATDTTLSRSSAGVLAVEGVVVPTISSTNVFTNKSFSDSTTYIVDVTDNTKRLQFDVTGTTGITGILQTAFTTAKTVAFQDVAGTVYVSSGTDVTLADGGTGASLTGSNGGIVYSTTSAMAILSGTATAGQMLRSGASGAPSWSTATFPSTATGTGTILRADGTNWVASTATYPGTATTAGTILRADGTNWTATTATYPTTTTINQILYSSAANTIAGITTANNQVLVTGATGIPAFSATLPSGVTGSSLTSVGTIATGVWQGTAIGTIYGGTNITSYTTGDILYASATNTLSKLAAGIDGYVLTMASGVPSWAASSGGGANEIMVLMGAY